MLGRANAPVPNNVLRSSMAPPKVNCASDITRLQRASSQFGADYRQCGHYDPECGAVGGILRSSAAAAARPFRSDWLGGSQGAPLPLLGQLGFELADGCMHGGFAPGGVQRFLHFAFLRLRQENAGAALPAPRAFHG